MRCVNMLIFILPLEYWQTECVCIYRNTGCVSWFVYCLSGISFMFLMHHSNCTERLRLDGPVRTFRGCLGKNWTEKGGGGSRGEGAVRKPHFFLLSPVWTSLFFPLNCKDCMMPLWMLLQLLVLVMWCQIFVQAAEWCNDLYTGKRVNNSLLIVNVS